MLRFRAFVWFVGTALFCSAITSTQTAQATVLTVTNIADSGPGAGRGGDDADRAGPAARADAFDQV